MDLSKWQDESDEFGDDDDENNAQDINSDSLATLKRQLLSTSQSLQQNDDSLGFDDNSDTEGFGGSHYGGGNENRLKSSNASVWSVEDEEDWGDVELPSQTPLILLSTRLQDDNNNEDIDWNGGAGITSILDESDAPDADLSDFEDGLNFDDAEQIGSTGLKLKSFGLFNGLTVDDDAPATTSLTTTTESENQEVTNIRIESIPSTNTPINDPLPIKPVKQKPTLITLEMMQGLSLDDYKSKLESKPSSTAILAPAASRTRSSSRLSQISSSDSIRDTKKKANSSTSSISSNTKGKNNKPPPPPRNLSRQSSAEEIDRRKAWVSHSKVPASKPAVSLIRPTGGDVKKVKKEPIVTSTSSTAAKSRDLRKPPLKVRESPAPPPPTSTKVFVRRTAQPPPPSLSKIKPADPPSFPAAPSATSSRGPPERWSSGSSRDMKRPPTHRVAFGRTLKDVPVQPQIKPKARRQPTLIKNLGTADTPKVVGSMVYDPIAKKWTGNEQTLSIFEKKTSTIKPTLIPNTPVKKMEAVGAMVFDPVKCVWLGNETEEDAHVFDEIDAFETTDTAKLAVKKWFYCDKALRDAWTRSETLHKLLIGSWYPRACDSRFIRDTSKTHLWEIRTVVLAQS